MKHTSIRHGFRLLVLVVLACDIQAQSKRLSTPEERARAAAFANRFEKDPFGKDENNDADWLLKWLDEVSDVDPSVCRINFAELVNARDPVNAMTELISSYSGILLRAMTSSRVAFVIQYPNKSHDVVAVYLAGIEGVLRTYESVRQEYNAFHVAQVDEWLEMKREGKLENYARSHAKKSCKS